MTVLDQTSGMSYPTLSAAISGSAANDVLLVPAGSYVENFPAITHSLTIDSVGGLASLSNPQPAPPNGRAVLDAPLNAGINLSISGLEISGAATGSVNPNGAGILWEIGNGDLTVAHSWIHGNEDGILTGYPTSSSPGGQMNVTIVGSEIDDNGAPPGSTYAANGSDHNIYAGALTSLTVENSYIHSVFSQGSGIKSRALATTIVDNRIDDAPTLAAGALGASYDIDIPDGGLAMVSGNVIEKGANAVNRYMVHFGGEGTYAGSSLTVSNNIFINDRPGGATAVFNQTRDPTTSDAGFGAAMPATIDGNTLYDLDQSNLFQDTYGPPFDLVPSPGDPLANVFPGGAAPALDTTSDHAAALPEPGCCFLLLAAAACLWAARHMRRYRLA